MIDFNDRWKKNQQSNFTHEPLGFHLPAMDSYIEKNRMDKPEEAGEYETKPLVEKPSWLEGFCKSHHCVLILAVLIVGYMYFK